MAIIPSTAKVLNQYNNVNTTYGGSEAMKAQSKWYTMQDVTDTVRPYQVFTALLTQSGDEEQVNLSSGDLTVGVTYYIEDNPNGADFTNVGAPNNEVGTKFIATGTTPNSWGEFTNLQYTVGAPTATVLENTIGNVWFTYSTTGKYRMNNSEDLFTIDKVWGMSSPQDPFGGYYCSVEPGGADEVTIGTSINGEASNDVIYNLPIEIRVYN